jgi:hypothetical protein
MEQRYNIKISHKVVDVEWFDLHEGTEWKMSR